MKYKKVKLIARLAHEEVSEDYIDEVICQNYSVIRYLDEKNIKPRIKWEMLNIIFDSKNYIKDFIKFIEEYTNLYNLVDVKRKEVMDKFNEDFYKKMSGGNELEKKYNFKELC